MQNVIPTEFMKRKVTATLVKVINGILSNGTIMVNLKRFIYCKIGVPKV